MNEVAKMNDSILIGVDAGGSHTRARVARCQQGSAGASTLSQELGYGEAGAGNPRASGFESAQRNILTAIRNALRNAELPLNTRCKSLCIGAAGAGRDEEKQRIKEWALANQIATNVYVTNDAEIVLASASTNIHRSQPALNPVGIALICGTGSMAWGRNTFGQEFRCGGWGSLLGDEGSGYWIGRAALQAITRAMDERSDGTELTTAIFDYLQCDTPASFIANVYAPEMTRERIAGLAPLVLGLASSDNVAKKIVYAAVEELSLSTLTVAKHLQLVEHNWDLAVTGGVILSSDYLRQALASTLTAHDYAPRQITKVQSAERGALAIAYARLINIP